MAGVASPESDPNLLVIEREAPDRYMEMIRLNGALRGLIIAADILVIGAREFEERSQIPGSVYVDASREGKVVHESV